MAEDNLKEQIGRWLGEQGYPLEFATAATFKKSGFRVMQGFHVDKEDNDLPREVDVIAEINLHFGDQDLIRIEHVVECKWSVENHELYSAPMGASCQMPASPKRRGRPPLLKELAAWQESIALATKQTAKEDVNLRMAELHTRSSDNCFLTC